MVKLSRKEKEAAEKFHKSRIAFAWVNGELVLNDNDEDDRDHQHWLMEDYGISIEEFEKLPRGYMIRDKIQLFTGSTFARIEDKDLRLPMADILRLRDIYKKKFPNSVSVWIYNGVRVGKVGEIWIPIEGIGELYLE